jgi:hypothetical protein
VLTQIDFGRGAPLIGRDVVQVRNRSGVFHIRPYVSRVLPVSNPTPISLTQFERPLMLP